ncbi:hypothetical protein GsuE55_23650 [Geobacillus subterraneus]|uniref:Transposase n=1 Tax=Geobacillus subterraneus TaxID=129338 RepID=A0A679FLS3_9BACL|nr:hypothetical protein GsuE55_23650 [Geobacillus subterraneus]
MQIDKKEGLSLRVFHSDTTDKTVYGAYESVSSEALQITHGCNRHHRWQKPIGFGLIGNEDGIPFSGDVHDGNVPDKTWNPEVLSLFLLALAISRLFQRRVRPFIPPERPFKGAGGRKLTRPTGQAIFQLFRYVNVVLLELPDGHIQRALGKPLTPDQRRILQGLGMDESIYV